MKNNFSRFFLFLLLAVAVFSLTASGAFADVAIKTANFPDSAFRTYVAQFDSDGDGTLSDSELAAVTEINVSNKGITKLNGIEYFTALVSLDCSHNYLTELDVSALTSLTSLNYDYNEQTTKLDVSNTALTSLKLFIVDRNYDNNVRIDNLYARNCTNLKKILLYWPKIGMLDLSGCSSLTDFFCFGSSFGSGYITKIILKNCSALKDLSTQEGNQIFRYLGKLNITNLDLSGCTALVSLDCSQNNITQLDLSDCTALQYLNVSTNALIMLDLSNNTALTSVEFANQTVATQTIYSSGNSEYPYKFDFSSLIPAEYISRLDASSIVAYSSSETIMTVDDTDDESGIIYSDGIASFASFPASVEYDFETGYSDTKLHAKFNCKTSSGGTPTAPTITTTSLNNGIVGLSYNQQISASGTTPITWSVTSGSLPEGLTLNSSSGIISGTPSATGTSTFTIQAKNIGGTATKEFTIVVGDIYGGDDDDDDDDDDSTSNIKKIYSKPKITTTTLFEGTVGLEYGYILKADGTRPLYWGLSDGEFPAGLTLNESSGQISGTPTTSGTFNFTVQVNNALGTPVSKDLTITINPAPEKTKPTILTSELEPGIVGINYGLQLMASGTPPIKWTVTKPKKLPKDLELSSSGNFGGIIRKAGKTKMTIKAENAYGSFSKIFTLQNYVAPNINLSSIKDAKVWKKYTGTFKTKPTATKPLTWTLGGDLPEGFSFDSSKGKITGTGSINGEYSLIIKASNPASDDIKNFTFSVVADLPKITLNKLPNGTDGKNYKAVVKATGTVPITYELSGTLPEGLSFDTSNGTISGTPTETCTNKKIKIIASNMAGKVSKEYDLNIKAVNPKFTLKSLPNGIVNTAYSAEITATGSAPLKITQTGLPKGLEFNSDERTITGTPTESGTFNVTFTASNSAKSLTKKYRLVINAPPTFNSTAKLPEATAGKNYNSPALSVSGTKKITFSLTDGALPSGMTFNPNNGTIRGKPTVAGTFTITVTAANSYGSSSKEFNLIVNAVPPKISGSLKSGKAGQSYSSALKVKGTAPFNWIFEGNLPDGLDFNDGTLSGTPTEGFDGYVTITASNNGGKDSKVFRLKITGTKTTNNTTSNSPEINGDVPIDKNENESDKTAINHGEIFIGQEREKTFVKIPDAYEIAAVLPEIYVTESGLYDLEAEISADIEAGAKLIWLAFPQNAEASSDDEIAEFYNSDGEEITAVPENHKIIVSAWFNENVIYAPVIAVKKQ